MAGRMVVKVGWLDLRSARPQFLNFDCRATRKDETTIVSSQCLESIPPSRWHNRLERGEVSDRVASRGASGPING